MKSEGIRGEIHGEHKHIYYIKYKKAEHNSKVFKDRHFYFIAIKYIFTDTFYAVP